eukprot:scaffold482_cov266-Amphora_coffeaeformis.AAC.29
MEIEQTSRGRRTYYWFVEFVARREQDMQNYLFMDVWPQTKAKIILVDRKPKAGGSPFKRMSIPNISIAIKIEFIRIRG